MEHLPPFFNPGDDLPGDRDFPRESDRHGFLDREALFQRALQFLPSLCGERHFHPPKVFICYAHGDGAFEQWIARDLVPLLQLAGIEVIFDKIKSGPGTNLDRYVEQIRDIEWILVIATRHFYQKSMSAAGSTVAREMKLLEERMSDSQKRDSVIPILLDGDVTSSLPPFLRHQVYVDLQNPRCSHSELFDLILQLYGLFGDRRVQSLRHSIQDGRPVFW